MKAKDVWSSLGWFILWALIGGNPGAALAGAGLGYLVGPTTPVGSEVQQAGDQDPGTPPDCKKFPKDTRCQDKKR